MSDAQERKRPLGADLAERLASHVSHYYMALKLMGVPPEDRITLTRDYQRSLVGALLRRPRATQGKEGADKDGG